MGPTGSTYPYEVVEEAVELFGNKVIPQFDTDPEARAATVQARGRFQALARRPRRTDVRLTDEDRLVCA